MAEKSEDEIAHKIRSFCLGLTDQLFGSLSDGFAGGVALFRRTKLVASDFPNSFGPRFHWARTSASVALERGGPPYKPRCKGFFCMGELYP